LKTLTRDDDLRVRDRARLLLSMVDNRPENVSALYLEGIREPQNERMGLRFELGELEIGELLRPTMFPSLLEGLKDSNPVVRARVLFAVYHLAAELPPRLESIIEEDQEPTKVEAEKWASLQRLREQSATLILPKINDPDPTVRWNAARCLGVLRSGGDRVIPGLIRMSQTETGTFRYLSGATVAPKSVKSGGFAHLFYPIGFNYRDRQQVRLAAIQAIGDFGPEGAAAVPGLIKIFEHDSDLKARWDAAGAIREIGLKAKSAIPALIKALDSKGIVPGKEVEQILKNGGYKHRGDGPIRLVATIALGSMKREARAAVPQLTRGLGDADFRVRMESVVALGSIGPDASSAISELAKLSVHETDEWLADLAAKMLAAIGPAAVPSLIGQLESATPVVRKRAMSALASMEHEAAGAIPALLRCLQDHDGEMRASAVEALGKIADKAMDVQVEPAILSAIKDHDRRVRMKAAEALGMMRLESESAIGALIITMRDRDQGVRHEASNSLGRIGIAAIPELARMLRRDKEFTERAALTLSQIARYDGCSHRKGESVEQAHGRIKAARKELFAALRDENAKTRNGAAQALGYIGEDIVPELLSALGDVSPPVRIGAAQALRFVGADAASAIESLRARLSDSNLEVRRAAESALEAILKPEG
jgi:HEAT repeat protein